MTTARTLDRSALQSRLPHQGRMCLLDAVLDWDRDHIHCRASDPRDPAHPLRSAAAGLRSVAAIEIAAQAMALHAVLAANAGDTPPRAGMLAAARSVRLHVPRLDTARGALIVEARALRGDALQAIYAFALHDEAGSALAEGRATVLLDRAPGAP